MVPVFLFALMMEKHWVEKHCIFCGSRFAREIQTEWKTFNFIWFEMRMRSGVYVCPWAMVLFKCG